MLFKELSEEEIDRLIERADSYAKRGQHGFARLEYLKALHGAQRANHRAQEINDKVQEANQHLVGKNVERYKSLMQAGDATAAIESLETALRLCDQGSQQQRDLLEEYETAASRERVNNLTEELQMWVDQGIAPGVQFVDRHRKWMMALTASSPFDDRLNQSENIISLELIPLYQKVIDEPENADARYNLGLTLAQYGLLQRATTQFQKYVELKPEDPEGYFILGNILADRGHFDEALMQLEKTLQLSPAYQGAYFYMADIYEKNDDHEEAARLYGTVTELDPRSEFAEEARARLQNLQEADGQRT
jgi:tetratricopeptide (TPR) repeat protein